MSERIPPTGVADYARRVEAIGYDGLLVPEAVHDGFLTSMAALQATRRLRVATSVLVAFPRSPMLTAHAAWDLQAISGGRFELGLGTQVRANIVGRYATPWVSPVARMREYVESLRAIFNSFQTGSDLLYEGDHYRFDRLQPFFNPGPLDTPSPPIHLGAVGPRMTRLAGEVADGLMSHPTHSAAKFVAEVTLPRIADGAAKKDRDARLCPVIAAGFVVTGADEAALARSREQIRALFGFLYSTPAYWPALDHAGYGDVGRELRALAKADAWDEMAQCIGDDLICSIAPEGCYSEIASILIDAYGALVDRITFPVPVDLADDDAVSAVLSELRAG